MSTIKETMCNALALGLFFLAIKPTQDIASFWKRLNLDPFFFLWLCSSKCEFSHEILRENFIRSWSFFTSYQMKFGHIFKILLFRVLIEAWRTEISFRYWWDEVTKHNQSHTNWSMNFVRPLWRRSNILITCVQSSVNFRWNGPNTIVFTHLAKSWTGIIIARFTNDIKETNLWAKFHNGC